MHAYLFSGATKEIRLEEIRKRLKSKGISEFDTIYIKTEPEEEHIGIEVIRSLKKRMILAPQASKFSAGVIESAHTMTIEAQNALLKLLEEPPPHAFIYCETENQDQLLPTIVSRCEVIKIKSDYIDNPELNTAITTMLTGSINEKLTLIDSIPKERPLLKEWVRTIIVQARTHMMTKRDVRYATLIRSLEKAHRELLVNVNPKLALDCAIVTLSK
jgi:hypothetical protein